MSMILGNLRQRLNSITLWTSLARARPVTLNITPIKVKHKSTKNLEEGGFLQMVANVKTMVEQEPFPMPYRDPIALTSRHEFHRRFTEIMGDEAALLATMFGQETRHSTAPLRFLTRISLQEMQIGRRHEGKFLLCRVITPAVRMVGAMFVVEDPNG
ncbi:hypothetical protein FRC20_010970 [Serendipita sp. 405]|nr:hypothetical protein FRC15_003632 [Serendipita sp. 397]KAG8827157.1 hypothetical protein FRC18_009926 [Serendipita sp. 400]KAG8862881.1 hypothetical protein FRC20_010970 [Serendipita sp. 405]